jgi:hypothetical protein
VKIVGIFLDCRSRFVIIIYNKDDDIRAAALVAAWMAGSLFIRLDGSKIPGSVNKIDHLGCRAVRQRMMGEARSW